MMRSKCSTFRERQADLISVAIVRNQAHLIRLETFSVLLHTEKPHLLDDEYRKPLFEMCCLHMGQFLQGRNFGCFVTFFRAKGSPCEAKT